MLHPGYTPRLKPPRKASNGRSSSLLLQRVRPMQVARSWGQHKKNHTRYPIKHPTAPCRSDLHHAKSDYGTLCHDRIRPLTAEITLTRTESIQQRPILRLESVGPTPKWLYSSLKLPSRPHPKTLLRSFFHKSR